MSPVVPVSVIIPSYNAERFITRTIESALAQAPYVREVLVVDDGSIDTTCDLVRAFGNAVRLVELPHSGNPSVSRNWGIEHAENDLVAFLDADDVWLPGKIAAQADLLQASPELAFVCTNAFRQTEADVWEGLGPLLPAGVRAPGDSLDALVLDNFVITSSVLAHKDVLVRAGLFSVDEHLPAVEDYDLWLRVAAIAPFEYVDEPWLTYRDWGASYRGEWSAVQTAQGLLRVLDRVEERFPGTEAAHAKAFRTRRARINSEISVAARRLGDRKLSRAAARSAIAEAPGSLSAWKSLARSWLK